MYTQHHLGRGRGNEEREWGEGECSRGEGRGAGCSVGDRMAGGRGGDSGQGAVARVRRKGAYTEHYRSTGLVVTRISVK